jgi:hypothetical protein
VNYFWGKHAEGEPAELKLLEEAVLDTVINNDSDTFDYLIERNCPMKKEQILNAIDERLQTRNWDEWRKTFEVVLKYNLVGGEGVTYLLNFAEKAGDKSFLDSYQDYNPTPYDASSGKDASTSRPNQKSMASPPSTSKAASEITPSAADKLAASGSSATPGKGRTGRGKPGSTASRRTTAEGGLGVHGRTSGTAPSVLPYTSGGLTSTGKVPAKVRQEGESKKKWALCSFLCCGQ